MKQYYKEYCAGCGLCQNLKFTNMNYEKDGFPYPETCTKEMNKFCDQVCPLGKGHLSKYRSDSLWGDYKKYYIGFSNDESNRKRGSSGGILTEICLFLIESNIVDGVIQVKCSDLEPTETVTVVSRTVDDVIKCAGSRYSISMPLINIDGIIEDNKKYAFVGKPCDVAALRNYAEINDRIKNAIAYYFSFFCAGTPSRIANDQMLETLGCNKQECVSLSYRGNGWPGKITAIDVDGKKYEMDYYKAWMTVLGRIIKRSCKFCVDSIGESADISCGDYWYLDDEGNPKFEEREGRNCIFTWTNTGNQLLFNICKSGKVFVAEEEIEKLKLVQPNHYNRRSTIIYKYLAMKLFVKQAPSYSLKNMSRLSKHCDKRRGYNAFKGTIKRIIQGKI